MKKMSETTKQIISVMAFIRYTIPNHERDSATDLLRLYENLFNVKVIEPTSDYLIKTFNEIYEFVNKPKKIQTNSLYGEFRGKTNGKQE